MKEQITTSEKRCWKDTRPNLLTFVLPAALQKISCDQRLIVMIGHENNRLLFFLTVLFIMLAVFWGNKEKW